MTLLYYIILYYIILYYIILYYIILYYILFYIVETINMTTTGFMSLRALYWPNYTYLKFCKYTVVGFL